MALVDVSGHRVTDALLAPCSTRRSCSGPSTNWTDSDRLRSGCSRSQRFYQSSGAHKFVSLIYGEIAETPGSDSCRPGSHFCGLFREQSFMNVSPGLCISFPPWDCCRRWMWLTAGRPKVHWASRSMRMNEWLLGRRRYLLLHTVGSQTLPGARGLHPAVSSRCCEKSDGWARLKSSKRSRISWPGAPSTTSASSSSSEVDRKTARSSPGILFFGQVFVT